MKNTIINIDDQWVVEIPNSEIVIDLEYCNDETIEITATAYKNVCTGEIMGLKGGALKPRFYNDERIKTFIDEKKPSGKKANRKARVSDFIGYDWVKNVYGANRSRRRRMWPSPHQVWNAENGLPF